MAQSNQSDFKIYHDQVQAGFIETLMQNSDAFNAASSGAIMLQTMQSRGDYMQRAFYKSISSLVSRRDHTDDGSTPATALKLEQDEEISVRLQRKVGPVDVTRNAMRSIGENPQRASFIIGTQAAKGAQVTMVNAGLLAAVTALGNTAAVTHDTWTGSPSAGMSTAALINGLSKAGDSQQGVVLWVMHSSKFFELMAAQAATPATDNVAGFVIANGNVLTLGRPTLVIDSPSLLAGTSPTESYYTLGLRQGAVELLLTTAMDMATTTVLGNEQLTERIQGEFDFKLGVDGFKWDTTADRKSVV